MWKNVNVNKNQIEVETDRAILINCPHNSKYDGFSFWHTLKLVRAGRNSAAISIGYTDDFKFKLIRYGKNRNVLDEVEIGVEEFEKMYKVEDENISARIEKDQYETHKPAEVAEVENNLKEELKDEN